MAGSEDYLDGLLNSVTKKLSEIDEASGSKKDAYLPPKTNKALSQMREDQFLRDFEADLDLDGEEEFLSEFERNLEPQEEKKNTGSLENFDLDMVFDDPEDDFSDEDFMREENETASLDDAGFSDAVFSNGFPLDDSGKPGVSTDRDPGDLSLGDLGELTLSDDDSEAPVAYEAAGGSADAAPAGMKDLESLFENDIAPVDDDEQIIDESNLDEAVLDRVNIEDSEDAALAEIGRMLNSDEEEFQIDENNLADPDSFASAESAAKARSGGGGGAGKDGENPKKKKDKDKEKKKGGGFLSKFLSLMFGDDSDEEGVNAGDGDVNSAEVLSAETDKVLEDMESEDDSGDDDKKKKKGKKEKKEKPKKEPKPKKEKPQKPPKEKKEKEEKPKGPKLPKLPVILIFLIAISFFVLVYLGTNIISKSNFVASARSSFDKGDYQSAYKALAGIDRGEAEEELYNRAKTLAVVSCELDAYYSLMAVKKYDLAIDCLIRGLGRAELENAHAEEWGCASQMKVLKNELIKQLSDQFNMTEQEAADIYAIEDRDDYSIAIHRVLEALGLRYN